MKKAMSFTVLCLLLGIYNVVGATAQTTVTDAKPIVTKVNSLVKKEKPAVNNFTATMAKIPSVNKAYAVGVSGAFSGIVGNKLILAGGYNYPQNVFRDKAEKLYFNDIFVSTVSVTSKKMSWKKVGELPEKLANGTAVTTQEALYIIGGSNNSGAKATCVELKPEGAGIKCETISWLPVTISDAGAACIDGYLYVVGGIQNGKPSSDVYRMNLRGDRKKWEKLPSLPEDPRIQPIVTSQKDASGKSMLYVWAGFNGWGNGAGLICGGYKYNPLTKQWHGLGAPLKQEKRVYLGGGNAVALGEDKIIAFGGFNYEILRNSLVKPTNDYTTHNPEWYQHNQEVYCFDTKTNKWSSLGSCTSLGTVHAAGAQLDRVVYNISGELKPGTNTNIITRMNF